jgi:hypothetical protein
MHSGDKPYVVTPTGQVDLATKGLSLEAVVGIVGQLLSVDSRSSLDEFGAVQYELPAVVEFPDDRFTVVAARGGDDLWVEVRRHRVPDEDQIPAEFFAVPPAADAVAVGGGSDDLDLPDEPAAGEPYLPVYPVQAVSPAATGSDVGLGYSNPGITAEIARAPADDGLSLPDAAEMFPEMPAPSDGDLGLDAFAVANVDPRRRRTSKCRPSNRRASNRRASNPRTSNPLASNTASRHRRLKQ